MRTTTMVTIALAALLAACGSGDPTGAAPHAGPAADEGVASDTATMPADTTRRGGFIGSGT